MSRIALCVVSEETCTYSSALWLEIDYGFSDENCMRHVKEERSILIEAVLNHTSSFK